MNINVTSNAPSLKKEEYFLVIKNINEQLETLAEYFGDIESVEIKLYDTMVDNKKNDKAVFFSINLENELYIKYQIADKWNDVINDIFRSLIDTIEIKNLDLLLN